MKVDKKSFIGANTIADAHICKECTIEVNEGDNYIDVLKETYKCFDESIFSVTIKFDGSERALLVHQPDDWEENRDKYIEKLNEQCN